MRRMGPLQSTADSSGLTPKGTSSVPACAAQQDVFVCLRTDTVRACGSMCSSTRPSTLIHGLLAKPHMMCAWVSGCRCGVRACAFVLFVGPWACITPGQGL